MSRFSYGIFTYSFFPPQLSLIWMLSFRWAIVVWLMKCNGFQSYEREWMKLLGIFCEKVLNLHRRWLVISSKWRYLHQDKIFFLTLLSCIWFCDIKIQMFGYCNLWDLLQDMLYSPSLLFIYTYFLQYSCS